MESQIIVNQDIHHYPTVIKLISYNNDTLEVSELSNTNHFREQFKEGCVNWIRVCGFGNTSVIETIGHEFKMRHIDLKMILNNKHVSRVETTDENILTIFNAYYYQKKKLKRRHVSIVLGVNYIITIEDAGTSIFENFIHSLEQNLLKLRERSVDILFHWMLNKITDAHEECINQIEEGLEELEAMLLENDKGNQNFGKLIQDKQKDYLKLKRSIIPFKEQFTKITRINENLINPLNLPYFNDIYDQLQYTIHSLDNCREIIAALLDLYISNNDLKMNDIMKRLTVVSTIFIPLTFVVGVWGMNFNDMPELSWKYGYVIAWFIMILMAFFTWLYFKCKKWF